VLLPGQLELTPALPPQLAIPCRPQICVHLGIASLAQKKEERTWKRRGAEKPNALLLGGQPNRHFAQSENAFNFHKTKGGREIRSTVNPAWGGRFSRATAAVARFRSPRGARPRNAEFLIRYQQLEIHVSHRQHEPNSNSNPQNPRFWPRGFSAFVAHKRANAEAQWRAKAEAHGRAKPQRRSCARAENFRRYGII
jgi:hypothetical protein